MLLESGQWLLVVDQRVMMSLTMPLDVLLGIEHFMHKNCEHWEFFVYKCKLLKSKKIYKLLYVFVCEADL